MMIRKGSRFHIIFKWWAQRICHQKGESSHMSMILSFICKAGNPAVLVLISPDSSVCSVSKVSVCRPLTRNNYSVTSQKRQQ